jgi:hypothetical protein
MTTTLLPTLPMGEGGGDDDEALEGKSEDEHEDAEGTRLTAGNGLETKRRKQRSF